MLTVYAAHTHANPWPEQPSPFALIELFSRIVPLQDFISRINVVSALACVWSVGLLCFCEGPLTGNKWIKCMKRSLSRRVEGVWARTLWVYKLLLFLPLVLLLLLPRPHSKDNGPHIWPIHQCLKLQEGVMCSRFFFLSYRLAHTHTHWGKEAKMTSRVKNVKFFCLTRRIIFLTPHFASSGAIYIPYYFSTLFFFLHLQINATPVCTFVFSKGCKW